MARKLDGALRGYGLQRAAAIVGMAALWPSLFNQLLYPVTFTYNRTGDPATYSFHLIYSVLVIGVTIVFACTHKKTDRYFLSNGRVVSLFGIMGAAGIFLVANFDFSSVFGMACIGVGVGFVALYVPTHFLFWSMHFARDPHRSVMVDMALSFVLFGLVTGVRLALGIHALEITLACPLVSTALAVYVSSVRTGQIECTASLRLRSLPMSFIVPCLVFVLLCNVELVLFNSEAQLQTQPPYRAALYFVEAAAFGIVAFIFRDRDNSRGASLNAFALVCIVFIGATLVASIVSSEVLTAGGVPIIAANIVAIGFVWMVILRDAGRMHASPTFALAVFLAAVVLAPRMVRASIMYQESYLPVLPDFLSVFLVTALAAFVAVVVAIVALMSFFFNTELKHPPAPADDEDDPALQRMAKAFDFSERETEIAQLALQNLTAKKIGERLFIADSTVNTHLKRIYRKAGVHSKQELIDLAEEYRH